MDTVWAGLRTRFFMSVRIGRPHSGAPAVIGLARLHCYQNGVFWLVDVPRHLAKERRLELAQQGWVVAHTELV